MIKYDENIMFHLGRIKILQYYNVFFDQSKNIWSDQILQFKLYSPKPTKIPDLAFGGMCYFAPSNPPNIYRFNAYLHSVPQLLSTMLPVEISESRKAKRQESSNTDPISVKKHNETLDHLVAFIDESVLFKGILNK